MRNEIEIGEIEEIKEIEEETQEIYIEEDAFTVNLIKIISRILVGTFFLLSTVEVIHFFIHFFIN